MAKIGRLSSARDLSKATLADDTIVLKESNEYCDPFRTGGSAASPPARRQRHRAAPPTGGGKIVDGGAAAAPPSPCRGRRRRRYLRHLLGHRLREFAILGSSCTSFSSKWRSNSSSISICRAARARFCSARAPGSGNTVRGEGAPHTSSRLERLCRTQVTLRSGGGRLASAHRKLRMTGVCAAPGWSNTCVSHCCSSAHATLSCSGACVLLSSTVQCCSGQGATVIIVARCSESALNVERRLTGREEGWREVK